MVIIKCRIIDLPYEQMWCADESSLGVAVAIAALVHHGYEQPEQTRFAASEKAGEIFSSEMTKV